MDNYIIRWLFVEEKIEITDFICENLKFTFDKNNGIKVQIMTDEKGLYEVKSKDDYLFVKGFGYSKKEAINDFLQHFYFYYLDIAEKTYKFTNIPKFDDLLFKHCKVEKIKKERCGNCDCFHPHTRDGFCTHKNQSQYYNDEPCEYYNKK